MDAWVYLFSKFSHEALLFEALGLSLGLFGYAIFYLIRKRKYGVAGKDIPSNIVKVYLAQLVADAEEMRIQLFGLLGKGEATSRLMAGFQSLGDAQVETSGAGAVAAGAPVASTQIVVDPKLAEKMRELEKRLAEQSNALDTVLNDKMKLEEELANAKANAGSSSGSDDDAKGGNPDRSGPMAERLKQLEAQLAEYAIIEDDLANLKRLQKENKSLKDQLADVAKGAPAATAAANAANTPTLNAAPAPAPAVVAPTLAAPEKKAAPIMPDTSGPASPDIATEAVDNQHNHDDDHPADFESLVDVVEKNLADAAKSDTVDPTTEVPPSDFNLEAGAVAETPPDEKSEEQLQADFEKMLNS